MRGELDQTKTQLVNCETQLQQALEPVSPPAVVVSELETPATEPITETTVFEPEQQAAVTGTAVTENTEPTDTTGTISRGELLEYITKNFPGHEIKGKTITNAVYRNGEGLSKLEAKYGFKFIGTINREYRFQLIGKL